MVPKGTVDGQQRKKKKRERKKTKKYVLLKRKKKETVHYQSTYLSLKLKTPFLSHSHFRKQFGLKSFTWAVSSTTYFHQLKAFFFFPLKKLNKAETDFLN